PLLRGRSFTDSDDDKAPSVVMINEAMAKKYWPKTDPIGDRLKLPIPGNPSSLVWNTIVGVVADARTESLADISTSQFYFCAYQRRPLTWPYFWAVGWILLLFHRASASTCNPSTGSFRSL